MLPIDYPKVLHMRAADPPAVLQLAKATDALSRSPLQVHQGGLPGDLLSLDTGKTSCQRYMVMVSNHCLKCKEAKPLCRRRK